VAYLLGFRFPINFNSPYIAGSFRNFWERWHITLSRWLRDYLYIPLGGNRVPPVRIYANLLIVMLLGGLWHGAAGTFLVWGAIHGVALAVERLIGLHRAAEGRGGMVLRAAWFVIVQVTVLIAWVFFRSASAGDAMAFLGNMVWPKARATGDLRLILLACLFLLPVVAMHLHQWLVERRVLRPLAPVGKAILAAVLLYATCTLYGVSSDFIYFQF
jgi:alginate O-acetyltransferase complex protein AlgI